MRRASVRAPTFGFGKGPAQDKKEENIQVEGLTSSEISNIKEQFASLDNQNLGFVNRYDLKGLLQACGEDPSEQKMQAIHKKHEDEGTRRFDLRACLKTLAHLKELNEKEEEEAVDYDILNTFCCLGGNEDKSGYVLKSRIEYILREIFEMSININDMFEEAGIDAEEELTFYDFTCLLESGGTQRASRICSIFSVA